MEKPWDLRERTMQFAVAVGAYCKTLERKGVDSDTVDQLRRSAAAVAANYRAGRKGRTGKEFISKFCIAIEEVDESHFWLSYLLRTGTVSDNQAKELQQEAGELTGILIASVRTRRKNLLVEEVLRKIEERSRKDESASSDPNALPTLVFRRSPLPFCVSPYPVPPWSELIKHPPDLSSRFLKRSVRADDEVRTRDLVVDGPLRGEAGAGFGAGQGVAVHDAADLFARLAGADDHAVELVLVAGLEEQRDVGDGDAGAGGDVGGPLADPAVDLGMDDRLEVGASRAIAEHDPAQCRTIERAVFAQQRRAEALDDRGEAG